MFWKQTLHSKNCAFKINTYMNLKHLNAFIARIYASIDLGFTNQGTWSVGT